MAGPALYDAVTLRHFAAAGRLDVLETRHGHLTPPRWTEAVHDEVVRGSTLGNAECNVVLAMSWLGAPLVPSIAHHAGIYKYLVSLNAGRRPPTEHTGEAESMYLPRN